MLHRVKTGMVASYWCPGCHAKTRGLPHGIHCETVKPAKARNGKADDLEALADELLAATDLEGTDAPD